MRLLILTERVRRHPHLTVERQWHMGEACAMGYIGVGIFGKFSWSHLQLGLIAGDSMGFSMNIESFLLHSSVSSL